MRAVYLGYAKKLTRISRLESQEGLKLSQFHSGPNTFSWSLRISRRVETHIVLIKSLVALSTGIRISRRVETHVCAQAFSSSLAPALLESQEGLKLPTVRVLHHPDFADN